MERGGKRKEEGRKCQGREVGWKGSVLTYFAKQGKPSAGYPKY